MWQLSAGHAFWQSVHTFFLLAHGTAVSLAQRVQIAFPAGLGATVFATTTAKPDGHDLKATTALTLSHGSLETGPTVVHFCFFVLRVSHTIL